MNRLFLYLTLAMAYPLAAAAESETLPTPSANTAMEQSAAAAAATSNALTPALEGRLEVIQQWLESPEFKRRQLEAAAQVRALMHLPEEHTDEALPEAHSQHRAVLFISSSIPLQTLRRYAQDLEAIGGVMVLRGLVGGMQRMAPTAQFIAAVLTVDPACNGARCPMRTTPVLIDPLLFRTSNITQVPALVFEPDVSLDTYCAREAPLPAPAAVIVGDASLSGLLSEFARITGDRRAEALAKVLDGG